MVIGLVGGARNPGYKCAVRGQAVVSGCQPLPGKKDSCVPGIMATTSTVLRNLGVASALASALAAGLLPVLTRRSKDAHWAIVELWAAAGQCLVFTPLALLVWSAVSSSEETSSSGDSSADQMQMAVTAVVHLQPLCFILIALSAIGFAGLGLQTYGYQREEAARASIMTVLEVPFAYLLQWQIFGQVLTWVQACGMVLVVLSSPINVRDKLQAVDAKATMSEQPALANRSKSSVGAHNGVLSRESFEA